MSTENRVQQFIHSLGQMETSKDVSLMVPYFTPDAHIGSIALRKPLEGSEGVTQFWTAYLSMFKSIKSEFLHVHTAPDLAVLEWKSEGVLIAGAAINYQGVSILEFTGDKISRFRTYYDSAAFLPDGAKLLGREVESI